MQEQIRNFITEFTNKQNKSEQDIDELKNNIVKFGCEIFLILMNPNLIVNHIIQYVMNIQIDVKTELK